MGREERRIYTVGPFWLASREQSPYLQIRWYDERAKVTRGKSTRRRTLDDAIPVILAHHEEWRARGSQAPDDASVAALLMQFWKDRGRTRRNAGTIASSFRIFLAFLDQDEVGAGVTVAELTRPVFERFIEWRLEQHSYEIDWLGKTYRHQSNGVSGEAVQRNLDDVRAALMHAVSMSRIPWAPKVPAVDEELRSPPRDERLTIDELGAIVGYAAYDIEALRWVLGMMATACRPDAVNAWRPAEQMKGSNFDTHPKGWPKTKKRNAVVPIIPEFRPWLEAWAGSPHPQVKSRKTWWRTMRRALGLRTSVVPKTIRHTIATELRARGVPMDEIAGLLGHTADRRITAGYAKYDPARLPHAKQQLSAIWGEVCAAANDWLTNHFRVSAVRGQAILVVRKPENV